MSLLPARLLLALVGFEQQVQQLIAPMIGDLIGIGRDHPRARDARSDRRVDGVDAETGSERYGDLVSVRPVAPNGGGETLPNEITSLVREILRNGQGCA